VLCIVILGIVAYSNTFHVPFQFDDISSIVKNPLIQNISSASLPSVEDVFELSPGLKNRFIGYATFALNYQLHGLTVAGYHMVNITIHILNAFLVYWLILITLKTPFFSAGNKHDNSSTDSGAFTAFFTALLFVSHPIQTQAVTYIVQRVAALATLFYVLSLVMYIKARTSDQKNSESTTRSGVRAAVIPVLYYASSLISAVFAMRTKEIAFTLPVIIALYEFMFLRGKWMKRMLYLIPLFLTMLIIPLTLIGVDKPIGSIISDVSDASRLQTTISRTDYLFTEARVIVTYIRLLLFPVNQNLDYDYPIYHSIFHPQVFLSFLFLFFIAGVGVYLLIRSGILDSTLRLMAFGIFWFFITLSVESSVIPIVDVIFEHRVYLPNPYISFCPYCSYIDGCDICKEYRMG
jgi:hypothetical protein